MVRRHCEDHLRVTPIKSGSSRYEQMKVAKRPGFPRVFATRVEPRNLRPLQFLCELRAGRRKMNRSPEAVLARAPGFLFIFRHAATAASPSGLAARSRPVERARSRPAERARSRPAERARSRPVERARSRPAERARSRPAERARSRPAERARSRPAERARSRPAKENKS